MLTCLIWNVKGGVGKTTTAACLGVAAESAGRRTALVDADPQGSLTSWGEARDAETPQVATVTPSRLRDALAAARSDENELAIVDLPGTLGPAEVSMLDTASLVLVPARPGPYDIGPTETTLLAVARFKVPAAIVLTQVRPRGRETGEMRTYFAETPWPVLTTTLGDRIAFPQSGARGLGVTEYEPNGAAAGEIRALFSEIWSHLE